MSVASPESLDGCLGIPLRPESPAPSIRAVYSSGGGAEHADQGAGARPRHYCPDQLSSGVLALYEQNLARRGFVSDPSQRRAVECLQCLYEEWGTYKARRSSALKRLLLPIAARDAT